MGVEGGDVVVPRHDPRATALTLKQIGGGGDEGLETRFRAFLI